MTAATLPRTLARLLRWGVLTAAGVVLAGGVGRLLNGGGSPEVQTFHGEPAKYRAVAGILDATMSGDWNAMIQLGVLLLIATPVARVLLSLISFARERDRTYVVLTALVLGILLFALNGRL